MTDSTPLDLDSPGLESLLNLHGLPWRVAPCKPDCSGSDVCTALRSIDGNKVAPEKVRALAMLAQELLPALLTELRRLRAPALSPEERAERAWDQWSEDPMASRQEAFKAGYLAALKETK